MCGICGTYGFDGDQASRQMQGCLVHRGPDDSGRLTRNEEKVSLGFQRLAIIDLSSDANQPMASDDGRTWITFNGEIYNYRELRAQLEQKGHRFRTASDTEVILRLFEDRGEGFLEALNGMFAVAVLDLRRRHLMLVRDRLGIKPLFYWTSGSKLAFASEIKALLSLDEVSRDPDFQALSDYLTFLYVPAPNTAYKRIKQLRPGELLDLDLTDGSVQIRSYWAPAPAWGDNEADASDVRDLLSDAVRKQLVSDVPLGVFLSGGIDSTIMTAIAADASSTPLKTFTVIFDGKGLGYYDERDRARMVADRFSTDHRELPVLVDPGSMLTQMAWMDQPFGNPTAYLMQLMSRSAREDVTVALAGAGGDELFAGYPRYRGMLLGDRLIKMPAFMSRSFAAVLHKMPDPYTSMTRRRAQEFFEGLDHDPVQRFINFTYFNRKGLKSRVTGPVFERGLLEADRIIREIHEHSQAEGLNKFLDVDIRTFLPDNILVYTDRMSMAASLEVRVPYLDHRLVEMSLGIPFDKKLRGGQSKVILKDAFRDLIPPELLGAPKRGFNVPLSMWMRDHLDDYFDSQGAPERAEAHGLFNWPEVQRLRHEHRVGRRDNASELFALIALDIWFRTAILEEDVEPSPRHSRR